MSFTVVIPARYGSSRFPGKPLELIAGRAMVCHVVDRARESKAQRVVVATDDQRIADVVAAAGTEVIMTSDQHPSGTDRLQEATAILGLGEQEVVVNVQGDEPLIAPDNINQVAENLLARADCAVATLAEPVRSTEELLNPNAVKLVKALDGRALYFSRAPIPFPRDEMQQLKQSPATQPPAALRHLGIYAYRVNALNAFVRWPVSALEQIEKLEQLRFMEHGLSVHVAEAVCRGIPGVDTPEDLELIRKKLESQ